ncbi:MAG: hypothetical protein LKCHEGNO_00844 [Burkholderiaceae bacterium]|nr:hypothetical protein [Burkholderiaceae bacterium]
MKLLNRIERALAALAALCVTLALLLGVISLSAPHERNGANQLAKAQTATPLLTP